MSQSSRPMPRVASRNDRQFGRNLSRVETSLGVSKLRFADNSDDLRATSEAAGEASAHKPSTFAT